MTFLGDETIEVAGHQVRVKVFDDKAGHISVVDHKTVDKLTWLCGLHGLSIGQDP